MWSQRGPPPDAHGWSVAVRNLPRATAGLHAVQIWVSLGVDRPCPGARKFETASIPLFLLRAAAVAAFLRLVTLAPGPVYLLAAYVARSME